MRRIRILAGAIGALVTISTAATASPPPVHLPDQTLLGLKISDIFSFPFHALVNCDVSDTAHLGAHATLILDYYDPAGATTPFAHFVHAVTVPPNQSVICGFGELPNTSYAVDHIKITVIRGRRRASHVFPLGGS